jgi:thiamine-phosphate pyrophosphorylase
MVAGEAGADYLLFGDTDADGRRPAPEAIAERIQWWAEVFQPPCVGAAATLDEARAFAAAGADFILLGEAVWADARGPRAALADIAKAIGATSPP